MAEADNAFFVMAGKCGVVAHRTSAQANAMTIKRIPKQSLMIGGLMI
jgi:hypothetical protein